MNTHLSDSPADLAALAETVTALNRRIALTAATDTEWLLMDGHCNGCQARVDLDAGLAKLTIGETALYLCGVCTVALRTAARWTPDEADAFFDARAYRDGVR